MTKTKQIVVFLPEMATCKHKRQYKCSACGKKDGCKEENHQLKVFMGFFRSKNNFSKKNFVDKL